MGEQTVTRSGSLQGWKDCPRAEGGHLQAQAATCCLCCSAALQLQSSQAVPSPCCTAMSLSPSATPPVLPLPSWSARLAPVRAELLVPQAAQQRGDSQPRGSSVPTQQLPQLCSETGCGTGGGQLPQLLRLHSTSTSTFSSTSPPPL